MFGISVACEGRLGADAEIRYTQSGKELLEFRMAVNDRENHQAEQTTQWIKVTVWEPVNALAAQLRKGQLVYVEGRLKVETWVNRNQETQFGISVTANRVEPLMLIGHRDPKNLPQQRQQPVPVEDEGLPPEPADLASLPF